MTAPAPRRAVRARAAHKARSAHKPRAALLFAGVVALVAGSLAMSGSANALAAPAHALVTSAGPAHPGPARPTLAHPARVHATKAAAAASWPMAGQNISDTHYQPNETAISTSNVGTLVTDWKATTNGAVSATPTVMGNDVYFPDWGGQLWALTTSGTVLWHNAVSTYTGLTGDLSRNSPAIYGNDLILGDHITTGTGPGTYVFAVNRITGKLVWKTLVDTNVAALMTGSATIYDGVVYVGISSHEETLAKQAGYQCCTFRGAVVALNASTGAQIWKSYMVPSNNGGGDSNTPGYYTGAAVWGSSPAVDPATGMVYVTTGNDYTVPSGVCIKPGQTSCTKPIASDLFDSVVGLNMKTGAIGWSFRTEEGDSATGACTTICGPDYDFGNMPNLFSATVPGTHTTEHLVGAGQKSGIYWALNASTGKLVWKSHVGPGGPGGGLEWGSATDGTRIYCAEADTDKVSYKMGGSGPYAGQSTTGGSWAALDPATGQILWQTPDPQTQPDFGYMSAANGVIYAGSSALTGNNMYALDASSGAILWSFASGGDVRSGAAIVGNQVFWGTGYHTSPYAFYAFTLPAGLRGRH